MDQDAWIYLTYLKHFFDRPFSFQPGHVTHGATSPLHVVLMSPLYLLGGLGTAKAANFVLVAAGLVLIHHASGARPAWLPVTAALGVSFDTLVQSTATLFETGVSFFLMSLLVSCVVRKRTTWVVYVAGLIPLARPELILVSASVWVWLYASGKRLEPLHWMASLAPTGGFYAYMAASGAGVIPTSVTGRTMLLVEDTATWPVRVSRMLEHPDMSIYLVAIGLASVAVLWSWRRALGGLLTAGPVLLLYFAAAPTFPNLAPRYLIPAIPGLLFCIAVLVDRTDEAVRDTPIGRFSRHRSYAQLLGMVGALGLAAWGSPRAPAFSAYTPDMILQRDLAEAVRGVVTTNDRVLMYEVQGQYHFPGFALSADGIVGSEAHAFLRREESFDEFIGRESITFIVTFAAYNYRPIYAGTVLLELYSHDGEAGLGDRFCDGDHCFVKVVTNPHFDERYVELPQAGLNRGELLRFYDGSNDPSLRGHLIQWNSVYQVVPAG